MDKALDNGFALQGMGDLGVELNTIESAYFICHSSDRSGGVICHDTESLGHYSHFIAMAHPYI